MVTAIQWRREISHEWALSIGVIIAILFGVVLVANPAAGALAMTWVSGTYALVFGLMRIVLAFRVRRLPQRLTGRSKRKLLRHRVASLNAWRKPVGMPRRLFGYTAHVRCAHPLQREHQTMRAAGQLSSRERHTMTDMRAPAN